MKRIFTVTIEPMGPMSAIRVPFDPREVFGKVQPAVKVTLNGYTYRSTISAMGGGPWIPLRRSNLEAAGLKGGETLLVTLELDTEPRVVTPPADLEAALKAAPIAWEGWQKFSFTHQREYAEAVDGAKRPETREKRIALAVTASIAKAGAKKA
ncbi:MAG: YdeI/OmpD-associated family protein [Alphaproteobacteria bacterium]